MRVLVTGGRDFNNRELLEEKPDLVVAFPGGRGTADMVRKAKQAGLEVVIVDGSPL